ncbi:MAG: phosphoribosylamine--glycine ligase [Planctomycetes bacterium]|nr:phosphoribosylamine--glycine ligase [Planctomycetota bacterium]
MKVLVVGGGGREHALCWKIAQSAQVDEVICVPGNAGTARVARNLAIPANDVEKLVHVATHERVGLVIVGPEEPLCLGLADRLRAAGIAVFGPGSSGARLEGSKLFAKEFLTRHRIPTAGYRRFDRSGTAKAFLEGCRTWPQVIKADGLASGKGVFVVHSAKEGCTVIDAVMEERRLGDAGREVAIEEFLAGEEVSVLAIVDGESLCVLEPVMDHKQVGDGDVGPNTGGMGVYSPVPLFSRRLQWQVEQNVLIPTLHGLRRDGIDYKGVLFVGLMLTEAGPRVLEYNCRFGDPETQAILRRWKGDLVPYLLATANGKLAELESPSWDERTCVGVVGAAEGYPGAYRKGDVINGLEAAERIDGAVVFHAGTKLGAGNAVVSDGGRVLCVTGLGANVEEARRTAYAAYDEIRWDGKFCRRDIGLRRARATVGEA